MMEISAPDALEPARDPSGLWLRRLWLGALFVLGLGFIVLVPPFQAVDEVAHWDRVWTVAQGDYSCRKLPIAASQFVNEGFRFDNPPHRGPVSWTIFSELYAFEGVSGAQWIATNGCHYPPVGYVVPALAARI